MNYSDIEKAMKGCYAVYHFAAQADIRSSSQLPTETINSNSLIDGDVDILEGAGQFKFKTQ